MDSIVEKLVKELKVEIQRIESFLGDGSANDYAGYREMVGKANALKGVLVFISDLRGSTSEEDF